jgi:hypothetical protein
VSRERRDDGVFLRSVPFPFSLFLYSRIATFFPNRKAEIREGLSLAEEYKKENK